MINTLRLVSLSLFVAVGCSGPQTPAPQPPTEAPVPHWAESSAIMTTWHRPEGTVAFTLSGTVLNQAGLLIRVASLSEVPCLQTVGGSTFPWQCVSEVDIRYAYDVSGGVGEHSTLVRPVSGKTWAEVRDESDVELELK